MAYPKLGPQIKQIGHKDRNSGSPSWVLVVVLGFICRWQHGDCLHRFHYEQNDLTVNESIGCFILRISLVIRHSKIKKNSYFSALTINEISETA